MIKPADVLEAGPDTGPAAEIVSAFVSILLVSGIVALDLPRGTRIGLAIWVIIHLLNHLYVGVKGLHEETPYCVHCDENLENSSFDKHKENCKAIQNTA